MAGFDPVVQAAEKNGADRVQRQEVVREAQRNRTGLVQPPALPGQLDLHVAEVILDLRELARMFGAPPGRDATQVRQKLAAV